MIMTKLRIRSFITFVVFLLVLPVVAQDAVPTLVSPTLVPTVETGALDRLPSQSVVAQIQASGQVRVGMLFNEPPYGVLNIQGDLTGFDADLARAIAEAWGVELELSQVTRQNWLDALREGRVDMVIAARVHRREWDDVVEFSHTYRVGKQSVMVRADDEAELLINLAGRPVAYVVGTPSEVALREWQETSGISVNATPYLLLDEALRGLFAGEVDAIVARQAHLVQVASVYLDSVKILPEPITRESIAIALPRQDVVMRTLVNRTLQWLQAQGRLTELHTNYFPGEPFSQDIMPIWDNVGDEAPTPAQFDPALTFPQQYAAPRILNERVLRVAGMIMDLPADAPESQRRIQTLQRSILDQFAERWGVRLEFVDGDPVQAVAAGTADIGLNAPYDWNNAAQVDYSQPYMLHGDRMMAPIRREITGFSDLRGRWVAVVRGDEAARDRAQEWADSISINVSFLEIFEGNATTTILEDPPNADVVYADSLQLIPHLEANPEELELVDRWYSREYMGFVLPRNDIDFRRLVNYTLQELVLDGTLNNLLTPVLPPGSDAPAFDVWTGSGDYLGLSLRR